jgi:CelD/BcsL family acetyltransferase involved in cellulose biosynthesis
MQVEVVRPEELGPAELDRWREFQLATPALQHAFLAPEFSVVVGRARPSARVAVLVDGGEVIGFFPFERSRLGVGAPIAANLTGCQGVVHAPGAEWDAQALLRACRLAVWEFDCLVEGQTPFQPYATLEAPSPVMDFSAGWDRYLADFKTRSPSTVRKLGQRRRRFDRETGGAEYRHDTGDLAELRTLMSWKSEQYRRTGRSDRFTWTGVRQLLEELAETRTPTFRGVLSAVYGGGRLAGVSLTLWSHRSVAGWFTGYDPSFGPFSPGILVQLTAAEGAAEGGMHELHMGRGTRDAYKQSFKSRDVMVAEGRVLRPTPAAALHWARVAPARRVRHAVTQSPRLLSAADATLHHYGRVRASLNRSPADPAPVGGAS